MSPSRRAALIRHETRTLLADKASLITILLMPLVMMAFFKPLARLALTDENPTANGSEYTVPAMSTMFAFFLVAYVGFAFFAEHRWNTWERLRASQATNAEILTAKVVPALGLCLVQQLFLFGAGIAVFGMRVRGSVLGLVLISGALSICLVAFGVLMAAVLKTEQQMNSLANLGTIVLAGVSGALVPLSLLPGWARAVAPIAPQYWAMRGFRSVILEGEGVTAVALPVAVLLGLAVVAGTIALVRLRFDEPKVHAVS
jgi:ABC-2 type transport system permease protein